MICTKCKADKPESAFASAPRNSRRNGRNCWCTQCVVDDNRRRRDSNPEHARALGRRHARLKRLRSYGLTPESFAALEVSQSGVCAICCGPETSHPSLAVDHDHATGRVRGLLCFACNAALGKFNDDPALLRKAAEYLEAHS